MHPRSLFIGAIASFLLAACASVPRPTPGELIPIEQLQRWQARGRIGVSGPAGGGSGSFDWRQDGDAATVQIRGPVGIGSVRLKVQGSPGNPAIELETGDGTLLHADEAWSELEARLGASLPAGKMRYWLVGAAAPGEQHWENMTNSEENSLMQDGWRIDYQRYSTDAGARLPVRLRATSGDVRVRIVVDRWQIER
jgi:outer membrane lipoprotein LolB